LHLPLKGELTMTAPETDDTGDFDTEAYFDSLAAKANGLLEGIAAFDAEVMRGAPAGAFTPEAKSMLRKLLSRLQGVRFALVEVRGWKDER
jgi:hypothetical protein